MFAPRAYILQRAPSKENIKFNEKDNGIRARVEKYDRSRSTSPRLRPKKTQEEETRSTDKKEETPTPTTPAHAPAEPVSVTSKPVVIPPRSQTTDTTTGHRKKSRHTRPRQSKPFDGSHDGKATSPAVAALLAVTNIPPPNRRARHFKRIGGPQPFQRTSIDELLQGWREDELPGSSSFEPGSPLDLLLENPDEASDSEYNTETPSSFIDDASLHPGSMSSRSVSSESIMSIPDLMREDRSFTSCGSPTTPETRRKPFRGSLSASPSKNGKDRVVSSPSKEDCLADHPLLPPAAIESTPLDTLDNHAFVVRKKAKAPQTQRKSSLKSNLTASLNAIASSFRSFSNFAAPSIPPDDLLTRNMFASSPSAQQRYASEMRPKSSDGLPNAALRRYLNPNQHTRRLSLEDASLLSAQTLHPSPDFAAAISSSTNLSLALKLEGPLIPMQTYGPDGKIKKARKPLPKPPATARDPNSEAGRAMEMGSSVRQREPRENSDFLRVIVLEMNMRREGKLDSRGVGRARVWLPPRKTSALEGLGAKVKHPTGADGDQDDSPTKVPLRWTGVGINEV